MCRVLVLGAGYVSAPVVEYLTRDQGLGVTVAAALKSGLEMENMLLLSNKCPSDSYLLQRLTRLP